MGRRVVESLAVRPDVEQVVAFDVQPRSRDYPVTARVTYRQGDLTAPGALDGLLAGCDSVIHLAWQTADARLRRGGDTGEANLSALRGVLEAVAATTHPVQVIHLSSATVYGAWPDNPVPLVESAPLRPNPEFDYAVQKAEAERVLAEWQADHEAMTVTVLRPAVTFGAYDRPLYRALAGTRRPRLLGESRPVQLLHVDDLADAVVLTWQQRLRGTFNVAPDPGISPDAAGALAGGLQRVALPTAVARRLSTLAWRLWRGGIPPAAMAYALHPWVVAADRLNEAGWQARYSTEETLVTTDERTHWDDLPLSRRQLVTLGGSALAAGTGLVVATLGLRLRRARLSGRRD